MSHPHTLSDAAYPIHPELLDDKSLATIDGGDAGKGNIATGSNNSASTSNNINTTSGGEDHTLSNVESALIDPTLSDVDVGKEWEEFTASNPDFYPPGLGTSDTYGGHDQGQPGEHDAASLHALSADLHRAQQESVESQLHGGLGGGIGVGVGVGLGAGLGGLGGSGGNENGNTAEITGSSDLPVEADLSTKGRKRARASAAGGSGAASGSSAPRKRPSTIQDPNDPNAHLFLPENLRGRVIEYATSPLKATDSGPVFIHPPQGMIQACVRCHGIKRKCEALEWTLRGEGDVGLNGVMGGGGVRWDKPRCSGCERADVPCVFELAAASSGFVHSLRSENAALAAELTASRQRIQELEISLAVSQTE